MASKIHVEPKQSADGSVNPFWALIAIDNGDGTFSLFVKDQPNAGAPGRASAITSSGASPTAASPLGFPALANGQLFIGITSSNPAAGNLTSLDGSVTIATGPGTVDLSVPVLGFTPENVANKTTDGTLGANSNTLYPSERAVKTYADTKQSALGFTPENVANKTTDGTLGANSDTLYPSEKAVKTYADTKQVNLNATDGSTPAIFPTGTVETSVMHPIEVVQDSVAGSADMHGMKIRVGLNGRMPGTPVPFDPSQPQDSSIFAQHFAGLGDFLTLQLGGLLQDGSAFKQVGMSLLMDNTGGQSAGYLRLFASGEDGKIGLDLSHKVIIKQVTSGAVVQITDVNESGTPLVTIGPADVSHAGFKTTSNGLEIRKGDDSAQTFVDASALKVAAVQVVGAQQAAIANAAGGVVIDAEARTALNSLLAELRTHGLIAT